MIRAFLAEDEEAVRESIKRNIEWEACGLKLEGEAGDGETAYAMIQETRPDILITDIMMPFMNGLELCELVKLNQPDIKIIIVSGCRHFEYASRALKIGVLNYLMKPVDPKELQRALMAAKAEIEEETWQRQWFEQNKREREEKRKMDRHRFFGKLVSGKYTVSEILERGMQLKIDLAAKAYNIVLFCCQSGEEPGHGGKREDKALDELVEERDDIVYFERGTEGGALLVKGKSYGELKQKVRVLVGNLERILKETEDDGYFIGVGKETGRLGDFPQCYIEANRAFICRYYENSSKVVYSEEMQDRVTEEKGFECSEIKYFDREEIENFLKTGKRTETAEFVEQYCRHIGKKNMSSMIFRQYILMDCHISMIHFLKRLPSGGEGVDEIFFAAEEIAAGAVSEGCTKSYLERVLKLCIEERDGNTWNRNNELVEGSKEYIRKHYGDSDISLNAVAAYVNVSPAYLSRIFSKGVGKTFVEYLTEVRISQAKELLRCTGMKTTEISRCLGYKDPHYFYYLFKKTVGCTPGEYRMSSAVQMG